MPQNLEELWTGVPPVPQWAGVGVMGTGDSVWDGLNLLVTLTQASPWHQGLAGEVGGVGVSLMGLGCTGWGLLWT